jgi:transcription antitermination factor NusG
VAEKKWYVVYTNPRWEKKISAALTLKGVENYCPLNKVNKKWTDRTKVVLEPLFKGYVFICLNELKKWDIKTIPGIINYVYWLKKPAVVKEEDIITIRKFLNEFTDVSVTDILPSKNEKVIVKQGVFMNLKGMVIEVIGNNARVKIESMGVALTALFERKNLEKL